MTKVIIFRKLLSEHTHKCINWATNTPNIFTSSSLTRNELGAYSLAPIPTGDERSPDSTDSQQGNRSIHAADSLSTWRADDLVGTSSLTGRIRSRQRKKEKERTCKLTNKCVIKWFIIKYLYLMTISWCFLTVRVPEDIVINCTRVIRRLTHVSMFSQTVFVISGMHYRAQ